MGKVFEALNKAKTEINKGKITGKGKSNTLIQESLTSDPVAGKAPLSPVSLSSIDEQTTIDNWNERLIASTVANSPVIENIKRLRNKILHPQDDRKIKSIMITSVMPEEGKSFITSNLGISMAQGIDMHALMLDCDLRRPSLAAMFGINNKTGLVDYLENDIDITLLIKQTGIPKLSLIPSGPPPPNPAELLDSKKMIEVIDEIVNRYQDRFILLDTPPMQAASETAVLAKHVDGVVLVVRWGTAPRAQITKLIDTVGKDKFIGIVFNAFETNLLGAKLKGYNSYQYNYQKTYKG